MSNWPPTSNSSAPYVDPKIQQQLSLIGGLMNDGRPKIRLVWGQSPEASIFWKGRYRLRYLYKWERNLIGYRSIDTDGKQPTKFFAPTMELPTFSAGTLIEPVYEDNDIGIPRWYVEQMMPPTIACADWAENRYDLNPETGVLEDSLGPPPAAGAYEEAFYMIASHEGCAHIPGQICYGEYRAPEQYDVEYVRFLFHQLNQEPYRYSWEEIPPPEVIVQALLDRKTATLEAAVKKQEETEYLIRSEVLPVVRKMSGGGIFDIGASFARARKF